MRFNKEERRDRRIFTECRNSRHSECPVWIKVKVYRNDRQLGKVFTGRYEKVYCECAHHANKDGTDSERR